MFKGKPTKVIITGDAKEEFEELNKVVGEEIVKGITSSDHQTLLNSIKQKIELLKVIKSVRELEHNKKAKIIKTLYHFV